MKLQAYTLYFNSRRSWKAFKQHLLRGGYKLEERSDGGLWCWPKNPQTGVAVIMPPAAAE